MIRPVSGTIAALVAAASISAQQPSTSPQGRSPEHARDLLHIDLAAVTRTGEPITDLKAEDVTVRIGGRVRPVRSLQLVSAGAGDRAGLPAPFGSNAGSEEPRAVALVIDEDSFRPGREAPLREAVDGLVAGLAPADRISLTTIPYGGTKVPLTTDHSRIPAALARVVGGAPESQSGSELACRTRRTVDALIGFIEAMGYRDVPTTVIFVSAGMAPPRRDAPVTRAPGMCELPVDLFRRVGEIAGAARAQFYIVPPVDLISAGSVTRENIAGAGFTGSDNPIEGLEQLAGVTGAKTIPLTGSHGGALARILRETSARYVAGVEPREDDRNERPAQLEVKVTRPDVEVRATAHVAFAKPERVRPSRPANPSPREMLSVMTVFRDLPLRATAFSSLHSDGKLLRVTAIAEPMDPAARLTSLVAALFDRDGTVIANWVASDAELARAPLIGAMLVEPGAYRLRVAAIDATGRSGTADYDVLAEIVQTGPLKLSSLVIGLNREGTFVPRLEFTTEPVAIGYLELYGGAPGMAVNAVLEVSKTANGPALVTIPLAISASAEGRYTARGAVPLGALAPGDYAVRAVVGVEGSAPTRVLRTVRKR
jgi:hypothetical protein